MQTTINVQGMTCGHCVQAVTSELSAIEGVQEVSVTLNAGAVSPVVIVSDHEVPTAEIAAAVDEAGYTVV